MLIRIETGDWLKNASIVGMYKVLNKIQPKHDSVKKGIEETKWTLHDHPLIACEFIRNNKSELKLNNDDIEFVCGCIASHMGKFNTCDYSDIILPLPKTPEQKFVHMCDFLASRKVINLTFDKDNNIVDE